MIKRKHTEQCLAPRQKIERHLTCKCWCHKHNWYPETLNERKQKLKQEYKEAFQ